LHLIFQDPRAFSDVYKKGIIQTTAFIVQHSSIRSSLGTSQKLY